MLFAMNDIFVSYFPILLYIFNFLMIVPRIELPAEY